MAQTIDMKKFEPLIKALQSQLGDGLVSLVFFGSRARGEGLRKSDYDIFLLADDLPEHPFERQIFLRRMIPWRLYFDVSIYAKTMKEFEMDFPAIYFDIATDGIILFDREGYVHKKLERIRDLIGEAGLIRRRKFGSLVWEWEEQPNFGWRIDWSGVYGLKRGGELQAKA